MVQSVYNTRIRAGLPGMIRSQVTYSAITRVNGDDIALPFGVAASQGVVEGTCVIGGGNFLGVTIQDQTNFNLPEIQIPGEDPGVFYQAGGYPIGSNVGLLAMGEIFVRNDGAAPVAAGTAVIYDEDTGLFNVEDGTEITGSYWVKGAAPGELGVISLGISR